MMIDNNSRASQSYILIINLRKFIAFLRTTVYIILMQVSNDQKCAICLQSKQSIILIPNCKHIFCIDCMKGYIDTLKKYNELTPKKLMCMSVDCPQQLPDQVIQKLYPGEMGFVLAMVRKRYMESKDPAVKIFNCKGFTKLNRTPLVDKPSTMGRDVHSRLMNEKLRKIVEGLQILEDKKICTNILSFNKLSTKEKSVQCYVCGVSYCTQCEDFAHQGKCQIKQAESELTKYTKNLQHPVQQDDNLESFLKANQMAKCLNPKCGLPIAKEQGCYWVKCRCSWQFCYPCQKLWGDCEHFSKYPYKKFVPPPQWMVKALNLY